MTRRRLPDRRASESFEITAQGLRSAVVEVGRSRDGDGVLVLAPSGHGWIKDRAGTGYWIRNQHELLVIAKRGDPPSPMPPPPSVIRAARREHSRKPDEAYELIERMFPGLPKIELFARGQRAGWDAWGNEAEGAA